MDDENENEAHDPFGISIAMEFFANETKTKSLTQGTHLTCPEPLELNKNDIAYYQRLSDETLSTIGNNTTITNRLQPKILPQGLLAPTRTETANDTQTVNSKITLEAFQKQQDDLTSLKHMFATYMA